MRFLFVGCIFSQVAAMDDLGRQLERLSDLLSRIQKALGEYLEKQREQFARFYFVGDEDLLEMIGNARDVKVVQRHVNKLFAGIAVLDTDPEDPTVITGMRCVCGVCTHVHSYLHTYTHI